MLIQKGEKKMNNCKQISIEEFKNEMYKHINKKFCISIGGENLASDFVYDAIFSDFKNQGEQKEYLYFSPVNQKDMPQSASCAIYLDDIFSIEKDYNMHNVFAFKIFLKSFGNEVNVYLCIV